jgi:hypothetical protein
MAQSNIRPDLSGLSDRDLVQAALPQLRRVRDDAIVDMQAHVPVDTGYLKSTVYADLDETTGVIEAGAKAHYALYVEMGHRSPSGRWVPAQPFIRPVQQKYRST